MSPRINRLLDECWLRTHGEPWAPKDPTTPLCAQMIETGFVRRCDMLCGLERLAGAGLEWTDAGRAAMLARDFAPSSRVLRLRDDATRLAEDLIVARRNAPPGEKGPYRYPLRHLESAIPSLEAAARGIVEGN